MEQSEVVSDTTQLKLTASDGKKYNTDAMIASHTDSSRIRELLKGPMTNIE